MLISPEYAALNREMHDQKPQYGTSGDKWAKLTDNLAREWRVSDVLDYGAGKGTLKQELERLVTPKYRIVEYDPAIPGKENKPIRADLVVCGDVMEHVEPDCVYDVLDDIRNISRVGVLFVISTWPAKKHLPDGRNAHLIVEPMEWWLPKLTDRWAKREILKGFHYFAFVGECL